MATVPDHVIETSDNGDYVNFEGFPLSVSLPFLTVGIAARPIPFFGVPVGETANHPLSPLDRVGSSVIPSP
jgi:hypothetical protein